MSREIPMIFTGDSVRANRAGLKDVTRRLITAANSTIDGRPCSAATFASLDFNADGLNNDDSYSCGCLKYLPSSLDDDPTCGHRLRSKWRGGDVLWVRENHRFHRQYDDVPGSLLKGLAEMAGLHYAADHPAYSNHGKLRPSIFLPRWACRNTYTVVRVSAERLHAITEEDARREGVIIQMTEDGRAGCQGVSYRFGYKALWDQINGKTPAHRWAANPWVWRIEYRNPERPEAK